jgi:hypothetical protein
VAAVEADLAEADRAQEPAAGGVLGEDARHELPEPGCLGGRDEPLSGLPADSPAAAGPRDVDADRASPGRVPLRYGPSSAAGTTAMPSSRR